MVFCFSEELMSDRVKITAHYDVEISYVEADKYEDYAPHDFSFFWESKRKQSFTLVYIVRGQVNIFRGSRAYSFSAGDCYFIPSGIRFRSHWTPALYYCFHFYHAADHFENVYTNPYDIQSIQQMSTPECGERFRKVWEALEGGSPVERARAFGELYLLWAEMIPLLKIEPPEHVLSAQLATALGWLEKHKCENIRVADAARAIHMSESAYYHMFSRELGESPRRYIERARVRASLPLVSDGKQSLSQIASECGFTNLSTYCAAFRRFYGITPAEYRKEQSVF